MLNLNDSPYLSSVQVVRIIAAGERGQDVVRPSRNFVVVVAALDVFSVFVSKKARLLIQPGINYL